MWAWTPDENRWYDEIFCKSKPKVLGGVGMYTNIYHVTALIISIFKLIVE